MMIAPAPANTSANVPRDSAMHFFIAARLGQDEATNKSASAQTWASVSTSEPDQYHEVRLGANVRINVLAAWRVFQIEMSRPRLHATSTAKSISGAMNVVLCDIPLLPPCQRRRPVSPGRVPFAQLAVLRSHPAP